LQPRPRAQPIPQRQQQQQQRQAFDIEELLQILFEDDTDSDWEHELMADDSDEESDEELVAFDDVPDVPAPPPAPGHVARDRAGRGARGGGRDGGRVRDGGERDRGAARGARGGRVFRARGVPRRLPPPQDHAVE